MTFHATICAAKDCQHGHLSHRYQITTRLNGGECLAPNCPCCAFEEEPA